MGIHILHILLVERQLADVVVADGIAPTALSVGRTLLILLDLASMAGLIRLAVLRLHRRKVRRQKQTDKITFIHLIK